MATNHAIPGEPLHRPRGRWVRGLARVVGVVTVLAAGITWAGVCYDQPVDAAIVAAMQAPECADVRAMSPGSLLTAPRLPDPGVCRALFLYRSVSQDAPADERSYEADVATARFAEFRELFPYVWALAFVVAALGYATMRIVRVFVAKP